VVDCRDDTSIKMQEDKIQCAILENKDDDPRARPHKTRLIWFTGQALAKREASNHVMLQSRQGLHLRRSETSFSALRDLTLRS
jgi:hypothetical protein